MGLFMHDTVHPLLLIGHGTRDADGRETFLEFAAAYQHLDPARPVVPCFLELTAPSIQVGVDRCIELGYRDLTAVPLLLFAARHNKFDVTNELDRARERHPDLVVHYGGHLGITADLIELWQERLARLDEHSDIPRSETLLLFVGRGSSDPDANGDACKMARLLWEGSGYLGVEVCFIGITHPRLEQGFERAWTWRAKRVVVLPYFLFTGVLVKRIQETAALQQTLHPQVAVQALDEIGLDPVLFELLRRREQEAREQRVAMNCELCKFRRAVSAVHGSGHAHNHGHSHAHGHDHNQDHDHPPADPYADLSAYHGLAWRAP
ncbi:sirohydrochlorin chelatase [Gloeobacter morelensis MG652769]|uniref:Sirohydrochlorin chelatase n=2 Tax=Gloeobacter TaxID=33071 RepID=A0ABY3PGN3_9CYAN|nr:sirohydrochlorin chelatase [Gloeobacter morelensis MG652769]